MTEDRLVWRGWGRRLGISTDDRRHTTNDGELWENLEVGNRNFALSHLSRKIFNSENINNFKLLLVCFSLEKKKRRK